VPEDANSRLFKWVAMLTGSKNALKGAGFFVGGLLLATLGFEGALIVMAAGLAAILVGVFLMLRSSLGTAVSKAPFSRILSKTRDINLISCARFFLFGGRDVWFVVGVPLFLTDILGWSYVDIGTFMATWVIAYGFVQAVTPRFVKKSADGVSSEVSAATLWAWGLSSVPFLLALAILGLTHTGDGHVLLSIVTVVGLGLFGLFFAVNSSLHSYLILAISDSDKAALNVGFYYMANAGGRFVGTLFSGLLYQLGGVTVCLIGSAVMIAASALIIRKLGAERAVTV
jgi:hypothetical protein